MKQCTGEKNPAATMVPCRGADSRMLQCNTCDAPPVHRDVHGASNIRELMAHCIRTRSRPAYLSGPAVARFTTPVCFLAHGHGSRRASDVGTPLSAGRCSDGPA